MNIQHYRGDTKTHYFPHGDAGATFSDIRFAVRATPNGDLLLYLSLANSDAEISQSDQLVTVTLDGLTAVRGKTTGIRNPKHFVGGKATLHYDVEVTLTGGYRRTIAAGFFELTADMAEPIGDDELPEVLATALVEALQGANDPSGDNVFATMADLEGLGSGGGGGGSGVSVSQQIPSIVTLQGAPQEWQTISVTDYAPGAKVVWLWLNAIEQGGEYAMLEFAAVNYYAAQIIEIPPSGRQYSAMVVPLLGGGFAFRVTGDVTGSVNLVAWA